MQAKSRTLQTCRQSRCRRPCLQHGTNRTSSVCVDVSASHIQMAHVCAMRHRFLGEDGSDCMGLWSVQYVLQHTATLLLHWLQQLLQCTQTPLTQLQQPQQCFLGEDGSDCMGLWSVQYVLQHTATLLLHWLQQLLQCIQTPLIQLRQPQQLQWQWSRATIINHKHYNNHTPRTTTTICRPLIRSICVNQHPQLRTGEFLPTAIA